MSVLMMMTTWLHFSAYTQSAFLMMMVCQRYLFGSVVEIYIPFFITEPFVVAFVETVYTVIESELMVEVCVNLTRPEIDILEETVRVNVFNNESSVYIPDGAEIASMLNFSVSDAVV